MVLSKIILLNVIREYQQSPTSQGRKRKVSLEYILDQILHVLRTGSQWCNLNPKECSWKTVYHYFSLWSKANLFEKGYLKLLEVYKKIKPLSKHLIVDTSFVKNVYGTDCIGRSPFDRGRFATKASVIVDQIGIPLQFVFHPGNKNDCKTLGHLFRKTAKHTDVTNCELYADKIYDTQECRGILVEHGLHNKISKKRTQTDPQENKTRIVVEHTFGWLDKFRRIILRFDQRVEHFRSFHYFAAYSLLQKRLKGVFSTL